MKKIFPISAFEFSYWKRRPAPYVTYLIIFTFSLLLFTLDQFSVNNSSEMSFKNSPSVLVNLYTVIILFAPIFINQYISFSVSRDFEYKFHELIYSYPVPRNSLFLGRFIGSLAVVIFILSAPILADLLAPIVPWSDAERLKPFNLINHLWCFAFILLPNIWIIGWILFYFTSLLKSTRYAIMISIGMVGIYLSFLQLTNNLSNTLIPALTDPFGIIPISLIQDKQSVFEQNHFFPALDYKYYLNRIIWIGISIVFYALSVKSLEKKYTKSSYHAPKVKQDTKTYIPKSNLEISKSFGIVHSLRVIHEEARSGIRFFFTGNIFIVFISTVFLILLLRYVGAIHTDDATPFATTYHTLNKFVPILYIMKFYIIFMIAEIFWRDKEFFFQDIKYSLPANPKSIFMGKVLSVIYYYVIVSAILMVCGIIYQLLKGDAPIDIGHYLFFFFVIHFFSFLFLSIFSFFLQNFLSNKFMAMALTAVILLAQPIIKSAWEIKSNMVGILPSLPNLIYSDFYGYEPYLKHYFAFQCYWFLIYLVLLYITACTFFGQDKISLKEKFLLLKQNFKSDKIFFPFLIIITSVHAGILYYQTQIKNEYLSSKEEKRRSAEYEKRFKKYTHIPMPKVTHADFKIDLFGKERKFVVRAEITLKNKTKQEIKEIYFTNFLKNSIPLRIENAKIILNDSTTIVKFQGFKLNKPMAPGDSLILKYTYEYKEEGLHNELPNERLLPNGTFLSMNYFTPNIGYVENYELSDNSERKKYGLPIKTEIFPTLEKNCFENCMNNYVSQSDWATVHTIISTYEDQIAIAPGTLIKEWKENNRNIFEYNLTQPSLFFFSIVSANFKKKSEKVGNINTEVYYHPAHEWNVMQISDALKSSISYYTKIFGPYYHTDARIIEFPQFSSFAQAYPGTMPYSESIGFTADYSGNENDINTIFHVVAHEMGHQWWAHQVTGAKMQGATLLSESFAEYSSTLILRKEFGNDMLTKFIRKSNRRYINDRKFENYREAALYNTDNQSYIYYQKAGVVLNAIGKLLGYDTLNRAMHDLVKDFAYREPPYPTSLHFLEKLYSLTPDTLKPFVKEHMEGIVIWDLNVKKKELKKINDKKFVLDLELEFTKDTYNPEDRASEKLSESKLGRSKRVKAEGIVEIGVFKKTKNEGKVYGEELLKKRFRVKGNRFKVSFELTENPDKAVVDPYFLNIWRDTEKMVISL